MCIYLLGGCVVLWGFGLWTLVDTQNTCGKVWQQKKAVATHFEEC